MKYRIESYATRYFIGVEKQGGILLGNEENIETLWEEFIAEDITLLKNLVKPIHYIGLDCYPPDFKDEKRFDYFVMAEVNSKEKQPGFVLKKLPEGRYMIFEIPNEQVQNQIRKVYQYVKENKISVHMGFDYEDFSSANKFFDTSSTLEFALLLNE